MGVNIVKYGNQTLIDLTDTTAVASDVAQGKYFYGKDGVKTEGTSSGGGVTFEWPLATYIETIEANSITNTSQAKAYFDNKYNYKFAILLSPLTVNNQVVYIFYNSATSGAIARWRNGGVAGTSIATNYDGRLVAGSRYIILSMDAPVNNMALPEYTEQELAEVGRIMMGYAIDN